MDGKRILLAAHRGDKFRCPENTMPAFEAAIAAGADMIETDIRMTKDGELVLIHDRSALRTTGVDKNIDELTLAEVKKLDAGHVFSEEFRGTAIPTVKEFIALVKPAKLLINWELKVYPTDFGDETAFAVADKLIELIEEADLVEVSMLNSFSAKVLEHIYRKHGRRFPLHGQGIGKCARSKDVSEISQEELFDWCCMYASESGRSPLDFKENFDYCIQHNILPCVCIADTEENYRKAIDYGCKMFTSNNIDEAACILKKIAGRQ